MLANSKERLFDHKTQKRIGRSIAYVLWVAFSFVCGAALASILKEILAHTALSLSTLNDAVEMAITSGLMYGLATCIAIGVPFVLQRKKIDFGTLGLDRLTSWSDMLLGPVAYIPYLVLSLLLMVVASAVIPGFNAEEVQNIGFHTVTNQAGYVMAFFTLVVIAPVAEEILFRGYLYGKLKRVAGLIGATLLTSLCFAVLHLQLNVGVDVFALSIILCILRESTGSIWAGILLHMLKNFIAFYFLFIAPTL